MISTIKKITTPAQIDGLIQYITNTQEHPGLRIIEGDPEEARDLMHSLGYKQKGWHIVISLAEEELPEEKKKRILGMIKDMYFAGYKEGELRPVIIEHTEKGHLHWHIVLPNYNYQLDRATNWNISTKTRGKINRLIEALEGLQPPTPSVDIYTPHSKQKNRKDIQLGEKIQAYTIHRIKQGATLQEIEHELQRKGIRIWVKSWTAKDGTKRYYLKATHEATGITTELRGSLALRWIEQKRGIKTPPPEWYKFLELPDIVSDIQKHIERRTKFLARKFRDEREPQNIQEIIRKYHPLQEIAFDWENYETPVQEANLDFFRWIFSVAPEEQIMVMMRTPKTGDGTKRTITKENWQTYMPYLRAMNAQGYDIFAQMPEEFLVLDDVNPRLIGIFRKYNIPATILETSPGKYHAILRIENEEDREQTLQILKRYNLVDKAHNGRSTRIPGFTNWKREEYRRWRVQRRTKYYTQRIAKRMLLDMIRIAISLAIALGRSMEL